MRIQGKAQVAQVAVSNAEPIVHEVDDIAKTSAIDIREGGGSYDWYRMFTGIETAYGLWNNAPARHVRCPSLRSPCAVMMY